MKLSSLFLGTSITVATLVGGGTAFAQSSSDMTGCTDIRYGVDSVKTPVLVASCLKNDKKTRVESYIVIGGFANKEGRLSSGPGPSTFQNSCRDPKVQIVNSKVLLIASCPKTGNREYLETSNEIFDVVNKNGQLTHRIAPQGKVVPPVK